MSNVDILFVAWNRLEFTQESLRVLVENTDWGRVRRLIVHDDGSTDGTAEWLEKEIPRLNLMCHTKVAHGRVGSPTGVANLYLREPGLEFLAKIDNDALMPTGWLQAAIDAMVNCPELSVLGLSAWCEHDVADVVTYEPAIVGGICFMRASAFECCLPWEGGRYGGSQMWMSDHMSRPINITGPWRPENPPHKLAVCGWIKPGISVRLLDHMNNEPWHSYSKRYFENGWQRKL